jgi:acyl-CoA thioesterase-1
MKLEESWPALLQQRLENKNHDYRVINSSASGDTSLTARNRLQANLAQYRPDLCLVEIGGNDGLQGLPASQLRDNLQQIIELCRRHTRHIFLLEIQIPINYGPVYRQRMQQAYEDVATAADVSLVPFFLEDILGRPGMMQADGIHPTAQAQPELVDVVWQWLEAWL